MQFLFYLNPKFQASSHLLWLYSRVCVGPGRKPRRPVFSQRGSFVFKPAMMLWMWREITRAVCMTCVPVNRTSRIVFVQPSQRTPRLARLREFTYSGDSKYPNVVSRFTVVLFCSRLCEPRYLKTGFFAYMKSKTQISCTITAQLISAFVFATWIVQSLYFLKTKFQASNHLV